MTTKPKSKKLSSANTAIFTGNITVSTIPTWSLGTSMTAPITVGAVGASPYTFNTSYNPTNTIKVGKVNITEFDIELDGLSLRDTMLAVKNELMIPTRINRNTELEREFDELLAHADRYYELEKKFLEQKKMWETLKKTDQ